MSKEIKATSYKSALKQEVTYQLENSLGKLKDLLGEKKFNSRVKKAMKLITEGIKEEKKVSKEVTTPKPVVEKKPVVVASTAKVTEKKTATKAPVKQKKVVKKVAPVKKGTEETIS